MTRLFAIVLVIAAACGGGDKKEPEKATPPVAATPAPATPPAAEPAPPPAAPPTEPAEKPADKPVVADKFDFDKLSQDDKVKFMKEKVVPAMKPVFMDFDAKKYSNFGCKTCHGKDPQKKKFKMPNAELPKLDFAKLKAGKQAPKVAEWMGKVVKPKMAELLEQPEYSESNPNGFGCLECHEQKK